MLLKLKNKHLSTLNKLLKDATDISGIPDYIEVDQYEAAQLIKECHALKRDAKYKDALLEVVPKSYTLKVYGRPTINTDILQEIINEWHKGEFSFKYCDVPLKLNPKKKTKNEWNTTPNSGTNSGKTEK